MSVTFAFSSKCSFDKSSERYKRSTSGIKIPQKTNSPLRVVQKTKRWPITAPVIGIRLLEILTKFVAINLNLNIL